MNKVTARVVIVGVVAAILATGGLSGRSAEPVVGHIYTLDNEGGSNGVVIFNRLADGTLTEMMASPVPTGGKGLVVPTGGDLDSQGPLRIQGKHLFAVNPGSDSITVFEIAPSGALKPRSGGSHPMSLAVHGDIVYVANQAVPVANPQCLPLQLGFRAMAAFAASQCKATAF
jgi:hypothetical protein